RGGLGAKCGGPVRPARRAPRRGPPALLALGDPRRAAGVAAAPRAPPAVAPREDASGLAPALRGRPDRARRSRPLRQRVAPSQARRPPPPPAWPHRPLAASRDCRREPLVGAAAGRMGGGGGLTRGGFYKVLIMYM